MPQAEPLPAYDDSFDLSALDRFTQEITEDPEAASERLAKEKAEKDALFDAIMDEELTRIAGEAKRNEIDLIPQVQPQAKGPAKPQQAPAKQPKVPPQPAKQVKVPQPEKPEAPESPKAEKAPKADKTPEQKKKRSRPALYVVGAVVLVLAIAICGLFIMDRGTILSNIYVAGVDVGDMNREAAVQAVNAATNEVYRQNDLILHLPDGDMYITADDTSVSLNSELAVDAAYKYGRVLGIVKIPGITKVPEERTDIDLEPYFEFNSDNVRSILSSKAAEVHADLRQSEVTLEERPIEKPAEEEPAEETDEDSVEGSEEGDEETEEGEEGEEAPAERTADKVLRITKGVTARSLDVDALYADILHSYSTVDFTPVTFSYDETAPDPVNLQAIFDENCTLPVDAEYLPESGELVPETLGYGFVVEDVQKQLDEAEEGETIEIVFTDLEPETTLDDLQGYMFSDLLASYDSPHTAIYNRTVNLELACAEIDGTIINDGEVFSFNKVVGERTTARGFREAAIYVNGDTEDQTGGGVCQVASTIYMCALLSDMEIVERECHYFQVTYVPLGMDATVYWGSLDFKFRNNTGYPIRIDASVSGGYVHIAFYGTDTKDYTVRMTYETTSYTEDGLGAMTYKHKLDSDGNEISVAKEDYSYYHFHKPDEDEVEDDNPEPEPKPEPTVDPEPPVTPDPPPVVDPPVEDPPVVDPPVEDPPVEEPPAAE